MPRKIQDTTKDYLINVPLPQHAASYTVISHKSIMDYALTELTAQGFTIVDEYYRATHDGQIAQGVYKLNYAKDTELSLMFAWSNSYNKQVRFRCVVGGFINDNGTVMVTGELGAYARKHTGTADQDTIDNMKDQLVNAHMYYDMLLDAKNAMKKITLSTRKKAELLGILFSDISILTTEQASIVKQQIEKPSYYYSGGADTLWAFYNHVTVALQQSHPRTWMEDQRLLHWFIESEFDLINSVVEEETTEELVVTKDPLTNNYGQPENQLNLLTEIENNPIVDTLEPNPEDHEMFSLEATNEEPETIMEEEILDPIQERLNNFTQDLEDDENTSELINSEEEDDSTEELEEDLDIVEEPSQEIEEAEVEVSNDSDFDMITDDDEDDFSFDF